MIIIGNDHAGIELKNALVKHLEEKGIEVINIGVDENKVDYYPETAKKLANIVLEKNATGILICGTGIGMSIAANKVKGIRAANCSNVKMAILAREHNDANILTIGARIIDENCAKEIVDIFISTPFSNEERHIERIKMIGEIENDNI